MAATTKPWAEPTIGSLTIGTGTAYQSTEQSVGDMNVSAFPTSDGSFDTAACIRAALLRSSSVRLLRGRYPAMRSPAVVGDQQNVEGERGCELQPNTDAASTIGLFSVTGSESRLAGFKSYVPGVPVPDQALIKITGNAALLDALRFQFQTAGVTANPTIAVSVGDGTNALMGPQARGCRFHPHKGVTVWKSALTRSFSWDAACYVGPRLQADGTRKCWRVFDLLDDEQWNIVGATFRSLGDATDNMDYFLRSATSSANAEGAHFGFTGNMLETIVAPFILDLWAARYSAIIGNRFGRCNLAASNIIRVTGTGGDADPSTAGNNASLDILISQNMFHNTLKAIELGFVNTLSYIGNHHSICTNNQIGLNAVGTGGSANTLSASRIAIKNNKFKAANGAGAINRVITNLSGASKILNGIWIDGNETSISDDATGTWTALVAASPSNFAGSSGRIANNYKGSSATPGTLDLWTAVDW